MTIPLWRRLLFDFCGGLGREVTLYHWHSIAPFKPVSPVSNVWWIFRFFFFLFFFCISILSELWSSCSWRCILSASTVMNCTGNKHESFGDDVMYDVILLKHRTRAASFRSASCSPFCSFRCRISSLSHTISFAAKQIKVIHSSCKTRMMAITDYTRKRTRASRIKRKPCRSCVIVLPMIKLICLLKAGFVFYCFLFRFLFFCFCFL